MTHPAPPAFDAAATSWRDFTQANHPPSILQRSLTRFCDWFVSGAALGRTEGLRRTVEICRAWRAWRASEAAFRERFVEKTLRQRAPEMATSELAAIVDRLVPRWSVVTEHTLIAILDAVRRVQAERPLPDSLSQMLLDAYQDRMRWALDDIERELPRALDAADPDRYSLPLSAVDDARGLVLGRVRAMPPRQREALTIKEVHAMYECMLEPLRHACRKARESFLRELI